MSTVGKLIIIACIIWFIKIIYSKLSESREYSRNIQKLDENPYKTLSIIIEREGVRESARKKIEECDKIHAEKIKNGLSGKDIAAEESRMANVYLGVLKPYTKYFNDREMTLYNSKNYRALKGIVNAIFKYNYAS